MKVLIADDDPVSLRRLEALLEKWNYEIALARNGAEAWEALEGEDAPRLAILDWMMPVLDGPQVCRKVRKRGDEPYIYILLLTAKGQKQDIVEGLEAGADDYLTKPFDPDELRARLRAGRRILALQEALISARDALRFQTTHDPLTGLWNRAATVDTLRRELVRAERHESSVGLVMLDLDHFKRINDTHGHLIGDAVLREAARRMRSVVRVYDSVGRYGGEEFLVIFPDCDGPQIFKLAERLRSAIGGKGMDLSEGPVLVTASLGVASSRELKESDANLLLRAADAALYHAKAEGRNRVALARPGEPEFPLSAADRLRPRERPR